MREGTASANLAELLVGVLKFYTGPFNYELHAVSLQAGGFRLKDPRWIKPDEAGQGRLAVEDPFTPGENMSRGSFNISAVGPLNGT